MGCCSVTQRHTGTAEVGPDEIELLEVDSTGLWSLVEYKTQVCARNESGEVPLRCPSLRQLKQGNSDPVPTLVPTECASSQTIFWGRNRQELHNWVYTRPIRAWEGQPASAYGEIIWSSLVFLHNRYTQERSERYLVLFSFHLLILALDNSKQDFIYEGVLPLSGTSARAVSQDTSVANMFEISGPMVESRVFICASSVDRAMWLDSIEERRDLALRLQLNSSHSVLSYLVPCDDGWKKEELQRYLLQAPIWHWEGTPIQHMGPVIYLSLVHILNSQKQGPVENLLVLFPEDLLLLSLDSHRVQVNYEGRLPRKSIRAMEKSALPGRLQFELTGQLMEPILVTCSSPKDYQILMFQLQQLERDNSTILDDPPPVLMPKKHKSR